MKNCFTSETQEANVSLKLEGSNRETYVQMVSGNQMQDQSKLVNGKGTEEVNKSKEVFFGENVSLEIVSTSILDEEQRSENGQHTGEVTCPQGKKNDDKKETPESSSEETSLFRQPEWFTDLDEVSKGKVRDLCAKAGPTLGNPEHIEKLQALFNIEYSQALEVNELYHSERLQKASLVRLKSILKSASSPASLDEIDGVPKLSRKISWRDEIGEELAQKHEMKTWHYMYYGRSPATQCCQIL